MKIAIVWFRDNLRIHDNESLSRAVIENDAILPVFIKNESYQSLSPYGHKRTGAIRKQFLQESLNNLQNNLKLIGGNLLVENGNPVEILTRLASAYGITKIYAPAAYSFDEREQEKAIRQHLTLQTYWESSLLNPEKLPFELNTLPDVFTNFRKKVEANWNVEDLTTPSQKLEVVDADYKDIKLSGTQPLHPKSVLGFKGGENPGLARLKDYFWNTKRLSVYKKTRNGLLGANYSSKFSPWLANGCLSPRKVYWEIKEYENEVTANESTYWLIFELLWRDYFKFVSLKYGSRLFMKSGIKKENVYYSTNTTLFEKWQTGNTGEPFVDANMRELLHTGFMSNRGRQNVASYLVHDLNLDWRLGADWFESQLIDYDACSNYGNWQYVAGVGNDPRPNRKFNIQRQADMYDPEGEYQSYWLDA